MEFLPTNLTSCIEQYGILPKEISYSILHDVALGLCYLHSQTPPIIHRDLSSNNVLLTPNMTAKISDLGVARILNLTPLQVSCMTQTPGTPAYMPPEVMIANPKYDTSVDEFSYGVLMIHVFSGRWPEPQVGPVRTEPGKMIPVSEAERREVFLQAVGNDHSLMDLILKCIDNHPQARVHASEIVERLSDMVLQFPASFSNRLEMLRRIETDEEAKSVLRKEGERLGMEVQRNKEQVSSMQEEAQAMLQQKANEIDQLKVVYFSEVEQLKLQVRHLNSQNQLLVGTNKAEVTELKSMVVIYESQVKNIDKTLHQERERFETQLAKERGQFDTQLVKEREESKTQLAKEREVYETQLTKEREQFETQLAREREQFETQLAKEREQFETQVAREREASKTQLAKEREVSETQLTKEREQLETQLAKERELSGTLRMENHGLQSEMSKSRTDVNFLQHANSALTADISRKDAAIKRNESELEARTRVLQENDAIISEMNEQLTRARECLATKQQVSSELITVLLHARIIFMQNILHSLH